MSEGKAGGMTRANARSIDPEEVRRFSALSDSWWEESGPFAPLHRMTPARMTFVRETLAAHVRPEASPRRPFAGLTVLDIGCGGGLLAEPMTRLGATVTGVDASTGAIAAAEAHAAQSGLEITYISGAAEDLLDQGRHFDVVVASEVIEHVTDPAAFLAAVAGLLVPGGGVLLTTLNRSARSLVIAKLLAEYVLRVLPAGTHDWRKFLTPAELRALLRRAGIEPTAERGISYDVMHDRFVLSGDVSVNYAMAAVLA